MAESIAQQLIGAVQSGTEQMGSNLKVGADLAQGIMAVQDRRAQLEQQKQELEMKKDEQLASSFETIGKIKSPTMRKLYVEKVLGNKLKALGREDMISPVVMEALQKGDQESLNRILNGITSVRNGQMDYATFRQSLQNPDDFITLEAYEPEFMKAQEAARDFAERKTVSRMSNPNERLQNQFEIRQYQEVKNDFDSATKGVRDEILAGQKAVAALKSGGPIAASAVRTQLARLSSEKGPLSDTDIATYGGSQDLRTRMETFMEKLSTGNIAPQTRKEYEALINEYVGVATNKLKAEAARSEESAQALGLDPKRARNVLGIDTMMKNSGTNGAVSKIPKAVESIKKNFPDTSKADPKRLRQSLEKQGLKDDEIKDIFKQVGIKE